MRIFLITLLAFLLLGASLEDARKANEAYRNGDYQQAVTLYRKAIDANPKNAKLYYNLASALAKSGNPEEAIRTFEQFKTMTDDAEQQAMANYNIGNILAEMKQWEKAEDYYKKSLRYMSADADAKHNYELAKQKKQQQKKQQQNQNSQNQQKKNQQQQQQNQQQQNNEQQNQNQQQNQQQNPQNQQQKQQQPNKISKEQAEKILNALEQKEKELLKQFKKHKTKSSKSTNEKDW